MTPTPAPQSLNTRWMPTDHEQYYVILGNGSVRNLEWNSTNFDREVWEFGNCFKEEAQATRASDAIKELLRIFYRA